MATGYQEMDINQHLKEIEKVISGADTARDSFVVDSWRRCIDLYGLDPAKTSPAIIVPDAELRDHQEQSGRLISIARSGLQSLFKQVAGQDYVAVLADAEGVAVDYFGDPNFESELRGAGLYLGSLWSEQAAGTNGIGTCLRTGRALSIHQSDHFDPMHTSLSCTSAPIYDTNGQLTAALNISLLRSPQPKVSQSLGLYLVKASARRIEMANLMALMRSEWVLRFSLNPELLDVDPEAGVALDGSGRIIGMTQDAARTFARLSNVNWRESDACLGQPISSFMHIDINDLPEFTSERPATERVLLLRDGSAVFGHAIAPVHSRSNLASSHLDIPAPLRSLSHQDPQMRVLEQRAAKLCHGKTPLLIYGETGVGKEKLARAMNASAGPKRPFGVVNCGTLQDDAAPETLFGFIRNGKRKAGMVENADGGMLFFDEISNASAKVQAMLLRLFSDREFRPVGSQMILKANVKIVSSTSRNLKELVRDGDFRSDLYFRLAPVTLKVPALRDRLDFDWLMDRLLEQYTVGKPGSYQLTVAARMELKHRLWPGNIRELKNVLSIASDIADAGIIDLEDLPNPALPFDQLTIATTPLETSRVYELETVLRVCDWNIARAARRLGVDRSTVHRRMQRLGIARPQ